MNEGRKRVSLLEFQLPVDQAEQNFPVLGLRR
jgi:hypothetical protein